MKIQKEVVSIVICTRNRKDDLVRALRSCYAQTYRPIEVLVYDDSSTDGTDILVKREFHDVRFCAVRERQGLVVLRNRGLRESCGSRVFFLDDDAYYSDPRTIESALEYFGSDVSVAVVAMRFVETANKHGRNHTIEASPHPGERLRNFVGCAHAVRKDSVLGIGGYREFFVHQGEERDLCIRLLDKGQSIVYAATPPIVHLASPARDMDRMALYGVRNTILFDWLNIPHPYLIPKTLADAMRLFAYRLRVKTIGLRFGYVLGGFRACVAYRHLRRPVSRRAYGMYRSLGVHSSEPQSDPLPGPAG